MGFKINGRFKADVFVNGKREMSASEYYKSLQSDLDDLNDVLLHVEKRNEFNSGRFAFQIGYENRRKALLEELVMVEDLLEGI